MSSHSRNGVTVPAPRDTVAWSQEQALRDLYSDDDSDGDGDGAGGSSEAASASVSTKRVCVAPTTSDAADGSTVACAPSNRKLPALVMRTVVSFVADPALLLALRASCKSLHRVASDVTVWRRMADGYYWADLRRRVDVRNPAIGWSSLRTAALHVRLYALDRTRRRRFRELGGAWEYLERGLFRAAPLGRQLPPTTPHVCNWTPWTGVYDVVDAVEGLGAHVFDDEGFPAGAGAGAAAAAGASASASTTHRDAGARLPLSSQVDKAVRLLLRSRDRALLDAVTDELCLRATVVARDIADAWASMLKLPAVAEAASTLAASPGGMDVRHTATESPTIDPAADRSDGGLGDTAADKLLRRASGDARVAEFIWSGAGIEGLGKDTSTASPPLPALVAASATLLWRTLNRWEAFRSWVEVIDSALDTLDIHIDSSCDSGGADAAPESASACGRTRGRFVYTQARIAFRVRCLLRNPVRSAILHATDVLRRWAMHRGCMVTVDADVPVAQDAAEVSRRLDIVAPCAGVYLPRYLRVSSEPANNEQCARLTVAHLLCNICGVLRAVDVPDAGDGGAGCLPPSHQRLHATLTMPVTLQLTLATSGAGTAAQRRDTVVSSAPSSASAASASTVAAHHASRPGPTRGHPAAQWLVQPQLLGSLAAAEPRRIAPRTTHLVIETPNPSTK